MLKLISIASGLALLAMSAPAAAVSVVDGKCVSVDSGCLFTGNIAPNTVLETQNAYNSYNNTHPSADPDITLNYLFKSDDAGFSGTVTGLPGSSGTWSTPGFLVSFLAVKAANNFVLYRLASPASSGTWNTFDIPYRNNPHDLSHLTFFGVAGGTDSTVPEPGTWAMLLAGMGLVGFAARRRRGAALQVSG